MNINIKLEFSATIPKYVKSVMFHPQTVYGYNVQQYLVAFLKSNNNKQHFNKLFLIASYSISNL